MTNDLEATIIVGGRRLKLVGTHATYMQNLQEWPADQSAVAMAVEDLPHGSLCLDVGAHIGLTAITVAELRPDCRVVAFEPLPQAHARLRQNISTNGIDEHRSCRSRSRGCLRHNLLQRQRSLVGRDVRRGRGLQGSRA